MSIKQQVDLNLEGHDGNSFEIIGSFRRQAKKAGWTDSEIKEVTNKAMEGDYHHLLNTIQEHCN